MSRNFLVIDPEEGMEVLKGLASPIRVRILKLLHVEGAMNGNDIADKLSCPSRRCRPISRFWRMPD